MLHHSETHTSNIIIKKHKNEIHSENEVVSYKSHQSNNNQTCTAISPCQRWMVNVVSEIALRFSHFVMVIGFFLFFFIAEILFCAVADSLFLMNPSIYDTPYSLRFGLYIFFVFLHWLVLTVRFVFILAEISFCMLQTKACASWEPNDAKTQIRFIISRTFPTSTSLFPIKICWFFLLLLHFALRWTNDTNDSRIENCTAIL